MQVTKGRWTWLTTSCDLPIREGLTIRTGTPEVLKARKMALELLWAEAPAAEEVADLAREMGVRQPRFSSSREMNRCILCGMCVKVCENLIGAGAIGFSQRGASRLVGAPFHESSDACIGCQACAAVCPTGHVMSTDTQGRRHMRTWHTELDLTACEVCGKPVAPAKQLDHIRAKLPEHLAVEQVCPACRRARTAANILAAPAGRSVGDGTEPQQEIG